MNKLVGVTTSINQIKQNNMTKVTLHTFKESGKWYDEIKYETSIEPWKHAEIIAEAKTKAQKGMNFTLRADHEKGLLYQLVKV